MTLHNTDLLLHTINVADNSLSIPESVKTFPTGRDKWNPLMILFSISGVTGQYIGCWCLGSWYCHVINTYGIHHSIKGSLSSMRNCCCTSYISMISYFVISYHFIIQNKIHWVTRCLRCDYSLHHFSGNKNYNFHLYIYISFHTYHILLQITAAREHIFNTWYVDKIYLLNIWLLNWTWWQ